MVRFPIRTKHNIVAGVEAEMLKRIRLSGGLSRVELARELRLSPTTSGLYVDRLVQEGILREQVIAERRRGRQPTILSPEPQAGRFVGVDFEAHNIRAMAVDFGLSTVKRAHQEVGSRDSVDEILARIADAVKTALKGDARPLLGIGIGVPGRVDPTAGTASDFPFISGWKDVPIVARLSETFDVPVRIENNIRSMAMAELWFGQGFGLKNFVCLGVRTGIGAGVVANGQLVTGEYGGAGQIGRWHVPGTGPAGAAQTLEAVASLGAVLRQASEATRRPMDAAKLRLAAEAGDAGVLRTLRRAAEAHAWAVDLLQALFDPQRIILMGPLAETGSAWLDPLKATLSVLRKGGHGPDIVLTELGDFSGAYGAAALAVHQWKPAR